MSSKDIASQYVPVMNCIFAAQKHVSLSVLLNRGLCLDIVFGVHFVQKILIDSCVLWQDSGFLQQVSTASINLIYRSETFAKS